MVSVIGVRGGFRRKKNATVLAGGDLLYVTYRTTSGKIICLVITPADFADPSDAAEATATEPTISPSPVLDEPADGALTK